MKGIILAGGLGTRLGLLTRITNKHLLNCWDRPMVLWPLQTLINAGIKDILIVTGPEHSAHFKKLLGNGEEFNVNLKYKLQDKPAGIAHALSLAKDFANNEPIVVILGDNIFEDDFKEDIENFQLGAKIFLKEIKYANRFGVANIEDNRIIRIEEKPSQPKSNLAVTGIYLYDNKVFDIIKTLKPSHRGELEITDVNNAYINSQNMQFTILKGFWSDAGTFDSLFKASKWLKENS